ncbi:MAG: ABC transporter ATP-binding protein [Candidatus Woesearchaeota archaeon]
MEPAFRVRGLTKRFGSHVVIDNINLNIMPGEIIGLIGSSGSGKTTLLNVLIGFLKPEKGEVQFSDHFVTNKQPKYWNVQSMHDRLKRLYGFAAQIPSFYPELTVQENLIYFGNLYDLTPGSIQRNTETLLKLMNLEEFRHLPAKKLSGGMVRRMDIACSLIHNPAVLFLDEPTADLDPVLRNQIWDLIRKINQRGTTIILASHHLTELEGLCNRIAILHEGAILDMGSPHTLKQKHGKHKQIILESYPGEYNSFLHEFENGSVKEGRMILLTQNPEHTLRKLLPLLERHHESIIDLTVGSPSLDDIFIQLTGDGK